MTRRRTIKCGGRVWRDSPGAFKEWVSGDLHVYHSGGFWGWFQRGIGERRWELTRAKAMLAAIYASRRGASR